MINQIYAQVSKNILNDPTLEQHSTVDLVSTIPMQWGFAGLTNGPDISLLGLQPVYSVAVLNEYVPFPPEFGAYVMDPSRGASTFDNTLNSTASKVDFTQNLEVFNTLLNTDALRAFYEALETENLSAL